MIKYKDFINEAWYSKHIKDNKTYVLVLTYSYDEEESSAHAFMYYDIYGSKISNTSKDYPVDFDRQGSAFALYDEYHIKDIIDREVGYSEELDAYMEIDKIKFLSKVKKPKDNSSFSVECVVTLKEVE